MKVSPWFILTRVLVFITLLVSAWYYNLYPNILTLDDHDHTSDKAPIQGDTDMTFSDALSDHIDQPRVDIHMLCQQRDNKDYPLSIRITPKPGFELAPEAPWSVMDTENFLKIQNPTLRKTSEMQFHITSNTPIDQAVSVELYAFTCNKGSKICTFQSLEQSLFCS